MVHVKSATNTITQIQQCVSASKTLATSLLKSLGHPADARPVMHTFVQTKRERTVLRTPVMQPLKLLTWLESARHAPSFSTQKLARRNASKIHASPKPNTFQKQGSVWHARTIFIQMQHLNHASKRNVTLRSKSTTSEESVWSVQSTSTPTQDKQSASLMSAMPRKNRFCSLMVSVPPVETTSGQMIKGLNACKIPVQQIKF
jgi:hypothetical protein